MNLQVDRMKLRKIDFISVILLAAAFFFVGLDRVPVPPVDGSIRANEARSILTSGQWFPIMERGVPVADHPPLYVWNQAVSMNIFGINDFAANFPERFFAFALVIVFFLFSRELFALKSLEYTQKELSGLALISALFLLSTRDFVLSSVRGYIESTMAFFIYSSLFMVFSGLRLGSTLRFFIAGVLLFFAFFAKGPPALWPFLFIVIIVLLPFLKIPRKYTAFERMGQLVVFLAGFFAMTALFIYWNERNSYWTYWSRYLNEQILSSAVDGRGGAQAFEPYYFLNILWTFYWPWLPLLVFALLSNFGSLLKKVFTVDQVIAILGLGFFAGFSLVKWKFWYYIAPAYPAFAISIALMLSPFIYKFFNNDRLQKFISAGCVLWFILVAVFPIPLHLERAPEVHAFKKQISESQVQGPVWFIHSLTDHNIIGSSGEWYFNRHVLKVWDADEVDWFENKLQSPAWIFTASAHYRFCTTTDDGKKLSPWCQDTRIVANSGDSSLLFYEKSSERNSERKDQ